MGVSGNGELHSRLEREDFYREQGKAKEYLGPRVLKIQLILGAPRDPSILKAYAVNPRFKKARH